MESHQDIDYSKKQKFDMKKTQERRMNQFFNPFVQESAKSKLENHAVSLRKKTRKSKILRKDFHEFMKNKQSQLHKLQTLEESKTTINKSITLQHLLDCFEKRKDKKFDELEYEARGLIYSTYYEVKDIETLTPLLESTNEVFQYIAVFGITRMALHFYMSSNYESFDYFSQFMTEHFIIDKITAILIMTDCSAIASAVVEVVSYICGYETEYEDFVIQAFTPKLVNTVISRIKDFDFNFKFTVYDMFVQFFDRFTNSAYSEWCADSPLLDIAIEDITNEPDFSTENLLLSLLETLLWELHFTTTEQRHKLGEVCNKKILERVHEDSQYFSLMSILSYSPFDVSEWILMPDMMSIILTNIESCDCTYSIAAVDILSNLCRVPDLCNDILQLFDFTEIMDAMFCMFTSEFSSFKIKALDFIDIVVNQTNESVFSDFMQMKYLSKILQRSEDECEQFGMRVAIIMSKTITRCDQDKLKMLEMEQILKLMTSFLETRVDTRVLAVIMKNIQIFMSNLDKNNDYIRMMKDLQTFEKIEDIQYYANSQVSDISKQVSDISTQMDPDKVYDKIDTKEVHLEF